ncbi:MAG: FapA family protein, partial [Lysinibacillus sp.]
GDEIPAVAGRDMPLRYDVKSAYEIEEDGKTVLRSKISGVLEHNQGLISVNHHLPIQGDVGVETGNINFEGSISIRGTVMHGFSVVAKGDISIEGAEGVSGAKLIKSIEGDIYIRGGIFGVGETRIEAGGSIFVKHVNEAHLKARNDINIGFYSMGSNLSANAILLDERKGKLIGGKAIAKSTIVTAISGNRLERRTDLIIESVNKQEAYALIQDRAAQLKKLQEDIMSLEEQVDRLSGIAGSLNQQQLSALEQAKINLGMYKDEAVTTDYEIKEMMQDLRNSGKEEITVTKEAYPGTYIQIGKKSSLLTKMTNGTFLLEYGELNV